MKKTVLFLLFMAAFALFMHAALGWLWFLSGKPLVRGENLAVVGALAATLSLLGVPLWLALQGK